MLISIPDKLTVDQSEKYILSIRLQPGGLSFSAYDPLVADSYFFRHIDFNRADSYDSSLKECFFANEFFSWSYKKVRVIAVSSIYTLFPAEMYREDKKGEILEYNFFMDGIQALTNFIDGEDAQLIFGLHKETYDFCSRSLIHPVFIHHLTPLLSIWQKQNQSSLFSQMFVNMHDKLVDIVCFSKGKLIFINSFSIEHVDDLIYYILYVWQQTGMDQQKDKLQVSRNSPFKEDLFRKLQIYLRFVDPVEIPSEAYLHGGEILKAPIDLIALSVCE